MSRPPDPSPPGRSVAIMQPATVRPAKSYPKLCAEAASLTTAPARLAVLSNRDAPMGPLALRNPQLPTARLSEALLFGKPAAWDNPAAPFVLWDLPAEKVRVVDALAIPDAQQPLRRLRGVLVA